MRLRYSWSTLCASILAKKDEQRDKGANPKVGVSKRGRDSAFAEEQRSPIILESWNFAKQLAHSTNHEPSANHPVLFALYRI